NGEKVYQQDQWNLHFGIRQSPDQEIEYYQQKRQRPVRKIWRQNQRFPLRRREQNCRYHHVRERKPAIEPAFQPDGAECRDGYDRSDDKRLDPAIPAGQWIHQFLKQCAEPLAMRSVLPAEHLPQRMLLKERGIVEFPLVRIEDVDRVLRDQKKHPGREREKG